MSVPHQVQCPICDAPPGAHCKLFVNGVQTTHNARILDGYRAVESDIGADARLECQIPAEDLQGPAIVKPRPTLVPARAILAVAQLITEQQAARGDGWRDVSAADHLDAAQRHLLRHQAGELLDESGHPHRVHAVARLLFAVEVAA